MPKREDVYRAQVTLPQEQQEWLWMRVSETWRKHGYKPNVSEVIEAAIWKEMGR